IVDASQWSVPTIISVRREPAADDASAAELDHFRARQADVDRPPPQPGAQGKGYLDSGALELERDVDLGTIRLHFSLAVQLHIKLDDFCDTKIPERFCGLLHRIGSRPFPGVAAGTDQFDDLVDAVSHVVLPFGMKQEAGAPCRLRA